MFKTENIKSIGRAYLEVLGINEKSKKSAEEDASNDKSDDGDGMDKVDPKAVKKKFKDRKDKDIDNDGDTDDSDEYLHKKRKAISKSSDDEDDKEDDDEQEEGKRGFIAAAKKAKENGDKKFTFAGKSYDVEEALEGKVPSYANRKTAKAEKDARTAAQRKKAGLDDNVNHDKEDMLVEDNNETYKWGDINMALTYHGVKPALIMKVVGSLKKIKSGKLKLKFKEEVNEADAHTKGAAPAEPQDSKDSNTAKKMRKDHEGPTVAYP